MASVRKAILYSSVTRYTMRFLGLASAMIVARLLTPEEIGTFAIASAIVMVMSEFRLLGAGSYLVREKELTDEKVRSATGLTVLISWGLGILIWLTAPVVAGFYELEAIALIFRILSISFFLAPFISIPTSLLMREFRFRELFVVKIYATVVNISTTIGLILLGFSFYALAWGYTIGIVVELMLITFYRPKCMPWRPIFSGLGAIARFGVYNSLANFLRKGVVTAPDMIIGKVGSTAQVGLFSRGLGFIEFVSQTMLAGVSPVVLPYLSDVKRTGGDINRAYIQSGVLLGGLLWPVLAVASVVSLPAILLFFGHQWVASAPYATLIAYWAMLRAVHWFSSDLMIARGFEKLMVVKEGIVFTLHFVLILMLFPHGLQAVAAGFVLSGLADLLITTWALNRYLGLKPLAMLLAWRQNVLITILCGLLAYSCYSLALLNGQGPLIGLLLVALVMPGAWLAMIMMLKHPLKPEVERILRTVLRR
ncbi:oligosaccharide flippase family protein [uncultured Marinobacter sp.]|uniref:oligosaccharide flippase family protein n=1 Tax=uncultured Marinobacter sp. TaxID=187379 RepID=UPI0030D8BA4D